MCGRERCADMQMKNEKINKLKIINPNSNIRPDRYRELK